MASKIDCIHSGRVSYMIYLEGNNQDFFFFFFLHHGYFTIVTAQSLGYIVFGRLLTRMGMRITLMTCPISIAKV